MSEITRVPLQPIAKGSLLKLWLSVLLIIGLGGGLAYAQMPEGVEVVTLRAGSGPFPAPSDVVLVNYVGKLTNGKVFDQGKQVPLPLDQMIPGFGEGGQKMQKGGKYELHIPSEKAYGAEAKNNPQTGEEVIPANSDLVFEVELLEFISRQDYDIRMQMLQQKLQQQQQNQGAKGANPAGQ